MPIPTNAIDRLGRQGFTRIVFRASADLQQISERGSIPAISYELVDCATTERFRLTGDLFPILDEPRWTYAAFVPNSAVPEAVGALCFGLTGANMSGSSVGSDKVPLPTFPVLSR
jgi:hypothetical protein